MQVSGNVMYIIETKVKMNELYSKLDNYFKFEKSDSIIKSSGAFIVRKTVFRRFEMNGFVERLLMNPACAKPQLVIRNDNKNKNTINNRPYNYLDK